MKFPSMFHMELMEVSQYVSYGINGHINEIFMMKEITMVGNLLKKCVLLAAWLLHH